MVNEFPVKTWPGTERHIIALLEMIELGLFQLEPIDISFASNNRFKVTGSPIELIVFNDCGEWDYLDSVEVNGIVVWKYADFDCELERYQPTNLDAWKDWFNA